MATSRARTLAPFIGLLLMLGLIVALGVGIWSWVNKKIPDTIVPPVQQCVALVGDVEAGLDLEQSHFASIIVAESMRRNLPPRAATIALATAMQESSLRNLNHGDRDSIGLFQQRPSQGWGTVDEIMDPWYASGKFYEHLVKVKDWQTGDINDVAQAVQRSGVPDGYRKHVENAKALSSALRGYSPGSWTCVDRNQTAGDTAAITDVVNKGLAGKVTVRTSTSSATPAAPVLTFTANDMTTLWAAVNLAVANTDGAGVASATVGSLTWTASGTKITRWSGTVAAPALTATVHLRP